MGFPELQAVIDWAAARLRAEAEAQEKRRQYYELQGSRLLSMPVKVSFEDPPPTKYLPVVYGTVYQEAGEIRIQLKPGMPLSLEHSVLCHELGHALKGHASPSTEDTRRKGGITHEILADGTLNHVAGVDVAAIYWQQYWQTENEAEDIGEQIMRVLFSNEEYMLTKDGGVKSQ